MKKISILVNDSIKSKSGWADFKENVETKLATINLEPESINEQIKDYVDNFYKVLEETDTSEKYHVDKIKLKLVANKNGKIALAGALSGDMGNSTTIEIEISRKNE